MPTVEIYGASDDVIEVSGDVRDEFDAIDCLKYLHFPDGTIVEASYGQEADKGWQFTVVHEGTATVKVLPAKYDDGGHYTDRLRLTGDVGSVECWGSAEGPTADDISGFFEDFDSSDYTIEQLTAARRILTA